MKPTPWIRTASVLTLLHAILHTIGGVFGSTSPGPATVAVDAMKANVFPLMGNMRSFWMFYRGMGLCVTIALTMDAVLLWLLANLARNSAIDLRPILATFLIGYLALSVNSYTYFFLPPVITELLIAGCLAVAIVAMKRPQARTT